MNIYGQKDFHPDILPLSSWSPSGDDMLLIAGPCSAESERQVINTAAQLVQYHVNIFRAGIWKPRSKPYTFEGCGEKGFRWLRKVKSDFLISTATEVMNSDELKTALDNGVDFLWLGTRTTINPYIMDDIAKTLQSDHVDVPIFIKNPIAPDLNAWIGAIERINGAGVKKIAVVHRGFQTAFAEPLRNEPYWEIPIKLKCLFPDMPVLSDPSHIAGDTAFVEQIIEKALKLDIAGLMVEVHCKPSEALSDKKQQLTPNEFGKILKNINFESIKHRANDNTESASECQRQIEMLRQKIDSYDSQLIKILSQRINTVKEIGKVKRQNNIPALQSARWNEVMEQSMALCEQLNVPKELAADILNIIHKHSIDIQ